MPLVRDYTDSLLVDKLSQEAEILFARLLTKLDCNGNYTADPVLIKSYIFPRKNYRFTDIGRWLKELSSAHLIGASKEPAALIRIYSISGKEYLHVYNYGQKLKWKKGIYPLPPDDGRTDIPEQPPPKLSNGHAGAGAGAEREEMRREVEVEIEVEEREKCVRSRENVFKFFLKKMPEKYPEYDSKIQAEFQKLNKEINDREQGLTGDALIKLQAYYNDKLKSFQEKRKKIIKCESDKFYDHYEAHDWKHKNGSPVNNLSAAINNWLNRINDYVKNNKAGIK